MNTTKLLCNLRLSTKRIERAILFIGLVLASGTANAAALSFTEIQIKSVANSEEIHCTASLIKFATKQGDRCALITDYHCVPGTTTPAVSTVYPLLGNTFVEDSTSSSPGTPLTVVKRSSELDLAELEIPTQGQQLCQVLPAIEVLSTAAILAAKHLPLQSQGFVNDEPHGTWSDNDPSDGISNIRLYHHGSAPNDVFLKFSPLKIVPGMSGGVVFDASGRVLGLNSQFIPFQNVAYATPISVVSNFILNGANSVDPADQEMRDLHLMNEALLSGNNSHAAGGNPQSQTPQTLLSQLLSPFQEPDEGVPTSPSSHTVLLNVNGKQIDGTDDYEMKYLPVEKNSPILVTREQGDYPSEDIRKHILNRLSGTYSNGQGVDDLYLLALDAPEGWKETAKAPEAVEISVDPQKSTVTFHFLAHTIIGYAATGEVDPSNTNNVADSSVVLHAQFSSDFKTLTLSNENKDFVCDNKNYLKLVCSDHGISMSLSLSELGGSGKLSYRFTYLVNQNGLSLIDYEYGKLKVGQQ